jgi:hypothetical protein
MTASITLESRLELSPDVLHRELEGEVVLLDLARGAYFGLDAMGTRMLELLLERRRLTDVLEGILEEFAVERAAAEADLLRLMSQMHASGLVSVLSPEDQAAPPPG